MIKHNPRPLRKLAARKAKWGFECGFRHENLKAIGEIVSQIEAIDPLVNIEIKNNMGVCDFKVYSESDTLGAFLLEHFCPLPGKLP
jgi:hypothetical protein